MFVARTAELEMLEEAFASDSFELVVVYGRRRVGKTRLISEFANGKSRVHFFTARETTARENLDALSSALLSWHDSAAMRKGSLSPTSDSAPAFRSFEDAFAYAFDEAEAQRTILVIDEYPYLAKSYPGISSLLQSMIDARKGRSRMMLILCGSSTSFMKQQVLGEKSPLYGRHTAQVQLQPFDYKDAAALLGVESPLRALELCSLVGGVPLYLEQLDAAHSLRWNIANRLFGQGRFLYAEPENFMLQEVQAPAPYNAIIGAIAHGRPRPAEIADATGIAAPNVNEHLKTLAQLGIVQRCTPVGKANKKQVVYRLADGLFRFWHTFVPRYAAAIESGMAEAAAKHVVDQEFSGYMGHAFEDACRQWLGRAIAQGQFDLIPQRIGMWWGADPVLREQADVDVVALGVDGQVVAGECKWTNAALGATVLETLQHRASLIADGPSKVELVLFAKSGFTKECERRAAQAGNVRLVTPADMFD